MAAFSLNFHDTIYAFFVSLTIWKSSYFNSCYKKRQAKHLSVVCCYAWRKSIDQDVFNYVAILILTTKEEGSFVFLLFCIQIKNVMNCFIYCSLLHVLNNKWIFPQTYYRDSFFISWVYECNSVEHSSLSKHCRARSLKQ